MVPLLAIVTLVTNVQYLPLACRLCHSLANRSVPAVLLTGGPLPAADNCGCRFDGVLAVPPVPTLRQKLR